MRLLTLTPPRDLPADTTPVLAVLSSDGDSVARRVELPLSVLPDVGSAEVVLVVALTQLSWHRVTLPQGSLRRGGQGDKLRAILQGLLEEQVLDDCEQLHFALAPDAREALPVWVAATDLAWLQAWMAALERAGRPVSRVVPELAPAPDGAAELTSIGFVGSAESVSVQVQGAGGACQLPAQHQPVMQLLGQPGASDAVPCWAEPAVAEHASQWLQSPLTLRTDAERMVQASRGTWDLAQFSLSAKPSTRRRKRAQRWLQGLLQSPAWRPARWAVLVLAVVHLGGLAWWSHTEQAALTERKAAIRQTLTTTFPDITLVIDAQAQMQRAVDELRRNSGTVSQADFETMLVQYFSLSSGLPAPTAMDYLAGELRLRGIDAAAAERSRILSKMQGLGFVAQIEGDTLVLKREQR